jgi:hypothetical protein
MGVAGNLTEIKLQLLVEIQETIEIIGPIIRC